MPSVSAVAANGIPERAKDPVYGWVLYKYHQGEAFDALTLLAVAHKKKAISGHGAYPELVEGGLMLSYGMTREAGDLFTRLLKVPTASDSRDSDGGSLHVALAPDVRNQAWFYLGKVFYLEGNYHQAYENLQRVNARLFEESHSELYSEWLYLKAELAMISDEFGGVTLIESLQAQIDQRSLWAHYLSYNMAMAEISAGKFSGARESLHTLVSTMEVELPKDNLASEHRALLNKSRLSLARLYLRNARFAEATAVLGAMPLDGVLSDRALFDFAIAAAGEGQMQLALNALNTLSQRTLFLPWREQVPYARGFVLEQMGHPHKALAAYTQAAGRYEIRDKELIVARQALTEENLMARLRFFRDSNGVITDAYGRLSVTPGDFGLSEVLATEPFQQALGELHELYKMLALLTQREAQLSTFETMLETRKIQREQRSRETRFELEQQHVDDWAEAHQLFRTEIEAALAREDAEFFMTTRQKALKARLDSVAAVLALLPDDQNTAHQRNSYQRMRAYFDWMVTNDYGVNRWAAQKQLRELDREMNRFVGQRAAIETLLAKDTKHNELATRLTRKSEELLDLKAQVHEALDQAKHVLMDRLDRALAEQGSEVRRYLTASRHAQARLTDQLFRTGQNMETAND
jgi:hypothetical protein